MKLKNISEEDFARHHPGGQLGKRLLLTVEDVMRSGGQKPVIDVRSSIREMLVAPLVLSPLSFYFLWYSVGLGMSAIYVGWLAAKGAPLAAIKDLMGHADIATTMRYVHLAPSTLRTAIEMLNPETFLKPELGQPVGNQWLRTQQQELVAKKAIQENPAFAS